MSLIYDALRSHPATEKPAPVFGSVSGGGRSSARHWRRASMTGGAAVVVLGVVLAMSNASERDRTGAQDSQPAQTTPSATSPETVATLQSTTKSPAVEVPQAAATPVSREPVVADIVEPSRSRQADMRPPQRTARPQTAADEEPASLPPPQNLIGTGSRKAQPGTSGPSSTEQAREVTLTASDSARISKTADRQQNQLQERSAPQPAVAQTTVEVGDALGRFNRMVARGELDEAQRLLEELRMRGLTQLALSRMTGYLALHAGRLGEARESYEQVLSQLPDDREAGLNLALVDLREGFVTEAERRLRAMAQLRPDDNRVRALLTRVRSQGSAQ